ncbi:glycosyltransferase family protein [Nisaea sp.]|uniref:glycosyltransferase family protein n=1 Tax=Nisaea sp. TaxID=2024842 RepID=UPI003B52BF88
MTEPRSKSLFLYVQNLLGIGHLRRAAAVARAAAEAGFEVHFVSGGMPVPDLDIGAATLHQLPPVRAADSLFKVLEDENGQEIDDAWKAARRDRLLALFEETRPAILFTELFPFGRRQMRFELLPLLDLAKDAPWRPKIVSSMRDILVTKPRPDRNREIVETAGRYYDLVLVHGDERVISLADTFPMYGDLTPPVRYTGYVLNPIDSGSGQGDGAGEIVVSAGGGAVGGNFMRALARLRPELPFADRTWRFVTGPHMPEDAARDIEREAGPGVIVERSRPDLAALISRAYLSISQAGYNTLAEILTAGTASVVIPFVGGVETEQRVRADLLARRGRLAVVPEDALARDTLAAAMERAVAARDKGVAGVDLGGAAGTARILTDLLEQS